MSLDFALEVIPEGIGGSDTTAPTPGDSGTLSTSSVSDTSFNVDYTKADDNESAQADIRYYLYTSTGDNVDTVSNAEENGTLQNSGGTLDVATISASGLTASTTYYFNVVVEDEAGNKASYTSSDETTTSISTDSQAGDEAWADAFSTAVTGLDATWDTPIDFDSQVPDGLTVTDGRVIEIDLRGMGLSGDIDIPEWENLKQCELIAIYHNSFDTDYPNAIHDIGSSLKHLYLCLADNGSIGDNFPHEVYRSSRGFYDTPKEKLVEENVIHGTINSDVDNLSGLQDFYLNFSDDWTGNVGLNNSPSTVNGIQNFPDSIWNIDSLVAVHFYDNWNVANQGNTNSFPASMSNLVDLEIIQLGGGTGSAWEGSEQGFMTGGYPSDMDSLPSLRVLDMGKHSGLSGFPDLSGSPDMVLINFNECSFSGTLPEWVLDGTIERGGDNSWQHFDTFRVAFPEGSDFAGGDLNPTRAGFSGDFPHPSEGVNMAFVDSFAITLNDIGGTIPSSFWDNNISKFNLSYTRLTSLGKKDLTGMTQTQTFRWKYCHIGPEDLPYIDWSNNEATTLWIAGNYYVFSNLLYVPPNAPSGETAFELWQNVATKSFQYSPQRAFGSQDNYDSGAGEIDFSDILTHTDNEYQWKRNGSSISGDTATLDVSGFDSGDEIDLDVTNPGISALTLNSVTITI